VVDSELAHEIVWVRLKNRPNRSKIERERVYEGGFDPILSRKIGEGDKSEGLI